MAQYSLGRYLKEYQANASYLLRKGWKGGKQDKSVFATWEISFDAIQQKSPEAAKLLLICGFFNNVDICEELLKRGMKLETHGMVIFYITHFIWFNILLSVDIYYILMPFIYILYIFYRSKSVLGIVLMTSLMHWYRTRRIN